MSHHFRRAFLAVPLLLAGLGVHADADLISYTFAVEYDSSTGQVPLFNPSYGTLEKVSMSFQGDVAGLVGGPEVGDTVGGLFILVATNIHYRGRADGIFDFSGPYSGGGVFHFPIDGGAPMVGDLALFSGIGNLDLEIDFFGGGIFEVAAEGEQTINYFYATVPEPSSQVLGSIGLAGVMWYGRRRRTQSRCPYFPGRLTPPA